MSKFELIQGGVVHKEVPLNAPPDGDLCITCKELVYPNEDHYIVPDTIAGVNRRQHARCARKRKKDRVS